MDFRIGSTGFFKIILNYFGANQDRLECPDIAVNIGQDGLAIHKSPQGFEIWSRSRLSDFALTFFMGLPITLRNNKEKSDLNHIRSNASLENESCWN